MSDTSQVLLTLLGIGIATAGIQIGIAAWMDRPTPAVASKATALIRRRGRRRYEQAKLDMWTEGIRIVSNAAGWDPSPATIDWTKLRAERFDVLIWDDNYFDTDTTRAEPTPIYDHMVECAQCRHDMRP